MANVILRSDNFILKDNGENALEVISCGAAEYYKVEIQISKAAPSGEIDDIYVKQDTKYISQYGLKHYIQVLEDAQDFIQRIYKWSCYN